MSFYCVLLHQTNIDGEFISYDRLASLPLEILSGHPTCGSTAGLPFCDHKILKSQVFTEVNEKDRVTTVCK